MNDKEVAQFFAYLGEIWCDMTTIEFLMRCAIAKADGEIERVPKPPFLKNRIYNNPRLLSLIR